MVLPAGALIATLGAAWAVDPPSLDSLLGEPTVGWRRRDLEERLRPTFAALLRAGGLDERVPEFVVLDMREIALASGLNCRAQASAQACALSFNCLTDPVQERVTCDSAIFDAMVATLVAWDDPRVGPGDSPTAALPYADVDPGHRPARPSPAPLNPSELERLEQRLGDMAVPVLAHEVAHLAEGSAGGLDSAPSVHACAVREDDAEQEATADARSVLLVRKARSEGGLLRDTSGPPLFNVWLSAIAADRNRRLLSGETDLDPNAFLPGEHAQLGRRSLVFMGLVQGDDTGRVANQIVLASRWAPEWATFGMLGRRALCGPVPGAEAGADLEVRRAWLRAQQRARNLSVLEPGTEHPQLASDARSALAALVAARAARDPEAMDRALADLGLVEAGLVDRGYLVALSGLADQLRAQVEDEADPALALRMAAHVIPLLRLSWCFEEGAVMTLRLGLRFAVEPGEEAFYPSVAATLLDAAAVFPLEEGTAGLETMPRALCAAWAVERDRADVLAARHMLAHTQAGARRAGTPDACLDAMRQDLVSRYPFRDMEGFRRWGESVPPPIAMSDAAWELLFWSQFDQGEIYQALGTVMLLANERGWPKQSPYACRLLGLAADPVAEQGMPERAALLWLEAADCELSYPADLVTARSALAEANALRSEVQDPNLLARLDFANAQMSFFFGGMAGAVRSIDRWLREQPDADDGDMLEGIVVGCVAEALGGGTFNAPDDRLRSVSRGEVPANVLPMLVLLERARRDGQISDRSWRALSRYLETGRPRALVCACGDGR